MPDHLTRTTRLAGTWKTAVASCELAYDARFIWREVITTREGQSVLVDLPKATSLNHGDALEAADGQLIEIIAADEDLLQIAGDNLVQLAWHMGNRHTACQIEADYLLIQSDPVIKHMLEHLGATVTVVRRQFTPEGGAFGRTCNHVHGEIPRKHDHAH
ncbi:urease accessory protein [Sulfitobacter undariae]|uniref:Urease accessory protein UreE n=1 Tax=Sulfitobacter undariae TaxID=1563671 RepID=A0A7W6ECA4_9RHOB|nr:urease accessory protein UreE [Sulfitobacter undariae]MBB3995144.1 urease accessory protein [Sulfitobacter undariae]